MYSLEDLLHLMSRLRDPQYGCPWDIKQTYATIVPHTLEEAYEVADAIERGDFEHLQGELGICCSRWFTTASWLGKKGASSSTVWSTASPAS